MSTIIKNSIVISNLDENFPKFPNIFKQFFKTSNLALSNCKYDIEELLKVSVCSCVTSTKILKTPKATSLEGQCLSGYKLIVEGNINEKFEYAADMPSKPLNVVTFNAPFTNFIVLPKDFTLATHIEVKSYIEDIYVELLNCKTILNNISLFLNCNICN